MYYSRHTSSCLVRFKLMCAQHDAFRLGDLELSRLLLRLLYKHSLSVTLNSDAEFKAELIAQECGCKIRYSRNFNLTHITY